MVSPADLRYTSLFAFSFALVIAMVFQFAGLPSLSSWAMILGGAATVVLRGSAVRLDERRGTRAVGRHRTSTNGPLTDSSIRLTEEQRRELIRKLEEMEDEGTDTDSNTPTANEGHNEDCDFDTETN